MTWSHPGADAFRLYVGQVTTKGPSVSVRTFYGIQKANDGTFSWFMNVDDEQLSTFFLVTAIDAESGEESDPSNVLSLTPKQFCLAGGCDDGADCTDDACGLDGACTHTPIPGACDDGKPCTSDACTAGVGCTHNFHIGPCNDHIDCTVDDVCDAGVCVGQVACDDGEVCNLETGECEFTTTTSSTLLPPMSTSTTLAAGCGDGIIEADEPCDPGPDGWHVGDACRDDCTVVACGDPDDSGAVTAVDSLFLLRVVVGASFCDPAVCNVDSTTGPVNASDALRVLRAAVGGSLDLSCPDPE